MGPADRAVEIAEETVRRLAASRRTRDRTLLLLMHAHRTLGRAVPPPPPTEAWERGRAKRPAERDG